MGRPTREESDRRRALFVEQIRAGRRLTVAAAAAGVNAMTALRYLDELERDGHLRVERGRPRLEKTAAP